MKDRISNKNILILINDLYGETDRHPEYIQRDVEVAKLQLLMEIRDLLKNKKCDRSKVYKKPTDDPNDIITGSGNCEGCTDYKHGDE